MNAFGFKTLEAHYMKWLLIKITAILEKAPRDELN